MSPKDSTTLSTHSLYAGLCLGAMRWAKVAFDGCGRGRPRRNPSVQSASPEPCRSPLPLSISSDCLPRAMLLSPAIIAAYPYAPLPLQGGLTPLHVAADSGYVAAVALLLATPGADPLARGGLVRGAQRERRGPPLACPTPSLLRREAGLRWTMRRPQSGPQLQPRCCGRTRASQQQQARRDPGP